jgi:hypothetical protein
LETATATKKMAEVAKALLESEIRTPSKRGTNTNSNIVVSIKGRKTAKTTRHLLLKEEVESLPVAVHEDHTPPMEDLSPAENRRQPGQGKDGG